MANIVEIIIRGKDATGGFSKPIKSLEDLSKAGNNAIKVMAGAVAGAVAALTALTVKSINTADEMGDMAEKAQMGVTEFSKLAYAAQLFDTSLESLNPGLKNLNKAMAESIEDPASKAALAFHAMGVSAVDSNGKMRETSQVLLELSGKFASYQDGANKAALALDLFGKVGLDMLPMLNQGTETLKNAMGEVGGVTAETATQADEFNRSIKRVWGQVNELGLAIAKELLPYLNSMSAWLIKDAKDGDTFGVIARGLADAVKFLAYAAYGLYQVLQMVGVVIGSYLAAAFELIVAHTNVVISVFKAWATTMLAPLKIIWELIKAIGELGTVMGLLAEGKMFSAMDAATEAATRFEKASKEIVVSVKNAWVTAGETIQTSYVTAFSNSKAIALKAIEDIQNRAFKMADFFNSVYSGASIQGATLGGVKLEAPSVAKSAPMEGKNYDFIKDMEKEYQKRLEMHQKLADLVTAEMAQVGDRYTQEVQKENALYDEKKRLIDQLAQDEDEYRLANEAAEMAHNQRLQAINEAETARKKQLMQMQLQGAQQMFGDMATAAAAFGAKGFKAYKVFASAQALIATYSSAVKAYDAMAGIPFVGPALAVAAAAAAIGAGLANVAMINRQQPVGAAHGGLDYVPSESTYLLQRGERVLSPNQNSEVMDFIRGGASKMVEVVINLDGRAIAKGINEMSRDGRLTISARAIA